MRIKYISFIESSIVSMNQIHETVVEKFSQATNTNSQGFEFCDEHKQLLGLLQEGFQTSNVIVLVTEISNYISTKGLLCRAMGLKCEKNKYILETIESEKCISLLNQNQKDAQSAIPVGAEAFITEDGLFSPFALKTSKQRLVMIPIDNKRITDKILDKIASFLEDGIEEYGSKIIAPPAPEEEETFEEENVEDEVVEEIYEPSEIEEDIPEKDVEENDEIEDIYSDSSMEEIEDNIYPTSKLEYEDVSSSSYDDEIVEVPSSPYEKFAAISESNDDAVEDEYDNAIEEKEEEIIEPEAPTEEKQTDSYSENGTNVVENAGHNRSIIAETIGNLSQSSIRVAFAIQESNNILEYYIDSLIELKNASCFKKTSVANQEEITDENQCKEAVSLDARTAMQKSKCMVGMAVSDVFADADGNDFIYAALADAKKTNVYKIYALEGEDPDTLVETGINSIFEILNERVVAFNEKLAQTGNTKRKMKKKKTMSAVVKILIWLAIVILLCATIGLLINSYFSGEGFIYELGDKIVSFFSSN